MEAVTMIKAAALAAQNKNNIGKILTILLGILLAPLILILMVYVQVMSAFSPEGLLQSPDTFDGANSAVYQSIHAVTDPFYEEIDTQLDAAESDIQRADAGSVVSGEACCGKYGTGNIYAWRTFYSAYRYY